MNILLIGEYSRLHNSLKEGLLSFNHEVKIMGFDDSFKNYPTDLKIIKKWDNGFLKKIKLLIYKLFNFDISSYLTYLQFKKHQNQFKNYDVVQLINENSFFCDYFYERKILDFIFKNNKKTYLLSCGDDYSYVTHNFKNFDNKSIIQPYLEGKITDENFINSLKFLKNEYKKLHDFVYKNVQGIIASDIDYHIPLIGNKKYLGLIANPINIYKIKFIEPIINDKIIIFLGINRGNYFQKGIDFFEEALTIIQKKYAEKVQVIVTENVPYAEYINLYDQSHILLDQIYAHDQGYNALEAMAKGKVVFTGAEIEFENLYNLTEKVAINALPNVDYLVNKLSFLIENPEEIIKIAHNARLFIENEHDYKKIAQQYIDKWSN